jgi:DNA-binding response OmpR family regulator
MMWKLLVIDDDREYTEQITDWFGGSGHQVLCTHSGEQGLAVARQRQPDVILLDIVMPGGPDGLEVLAELKGDEKTRQIPVVIWSYRADELDGLRFLLPAGLREGADYVVAKKWGMAALEEVVRKLLRAKETPPEQERGHTISVGCHTLKLGANCTDVWVDGEHREPTPTQAEILAFFDSRRGDWCSVEQILDAVYGGGAESSTVYKHVRRIRETIEPNPAAPIFLEARRAYGYRLTPGD